MKLRLRLAEYIFLLISVLTFSQILAANPLSNNLLEYSLTLEHHTRDFKFDTTTHSTNFDYIGINWYESFSRYFNAGLEIGQLEMSQASNNLPSAQLSSGQYAGLLFQYVPFKNNQISFLLNFNYRYNRSNWTVLNQQSQFVWHESLLSSELLFRTFNKKNISLAIDYFQQRGEQRDSGPISQISPFREKDNWRYRLGVDLMSDRHSIIRLEWLTGAYSGARINFKYRPQ